MRKNPVTTKAPAEQVAKDIRHSTRKLHSPEEKIRIVLTGRRGEDSIAEVCRKKGIAQSLYYSWYSEFSEAGKKRRHGTGLCRTLIDHRNPCSAAIVPKIGQFSPITLGWQCSTAR